MVCLHEFVGCTNHRRLVTGSPTYQFDPRAHCCIGDVSEIPRYQIIDAIGHCNCNMRGIHGGFAGNRTEIKKNVGKFLRIFGHIKEGNGFQHFETGTSGVRVAC